jgi:hypothetical protein
MNDDYLGNARTTLHELGAIHSSDVVPLTNTALQCNRRLRYIVRPNRACAAPARPPHSLRLPKLLHMHCV